MNTSKENSRSKNSPRRASIKQRERRPSALGKKPIESRVQTLLHIKELDPKKKAGINIENRKTRTLEDVEKKNDNQLNNDEVETKEGKDKTKSKFGEMNNEEVDLESFYNNTRQDHETIIENVNNWDSSPESPKKGKSQNTEEDIEADLYRNWNENYTKEETLEAQLFNRNIDLMELEFKELKGKQIDETVQSCVNSELKKDNETILSKDNHTPKNDDSKKLDDEDKNSQDSNYSKRSKVRRNDTGFPDIMSDSKKKLELNISQNIDEKIEEANEDEDAQSNKSHIDEQDPQGKLTASIDNRGVIEPVIDNTMIDNNDENVTVIKDKEESVNNDKENVPVEEVDLKQDVNENFDEEKSKKSNVEVDNENEGLGVPKENVNKRPSIANMLENIPGEMIVNKEDREPRKSNIGSDLAKDLEDIDVGQP